MIGLFNTGEPQARATMDRLQHIAAQKPLELEGGEMITLSFNVGICQHNGLDRAEEFFRKADAELISQRSFSLRNGARTS